MNYLRHYMLLIEKAQQQNRRRVSDIYYEQHHIIPKSEGGTDEPCNLVLLTAREHFIAHWLLYRADPEIPSRAHSFWRMCRGRGKTKPKDWVIIPSRAYEEARLAHSEAIKKQLKGKKKSPDHIKKVAEANRGKKRSTEARSKMSVAAKKRGIPSGYSQMAKAAQIANRKPTLQLDPDTLEVLKEYPQLKDAAREFNLHPGNISTAIKKETTSGGFKWKFK